MKISVLVPTWNIKVRCYFKSTRYRQIHYLMNFKLIVAMTTGLSYLTTGTVDRYLTARQPAPQILTMTMAFPPSIAPKMI